MIRAYKYRLYPTKVQIEHLTRILDIHRWVYNDALTERTEAWKMCRQSVSYYDQAMQLKAIRRFDPDVAWCNFTSLQQTLRRLNKAFGTFFRRVKQGLDKPGYPKYKSRKTFRSVSYVYNDGIRLRNGRLYVQNVGEIRIFKHRPLPVGATVKQAVIMRDKGWDWYVVFQVEAPTDTPHLVPGPAVGLDMGLESFVALSTGELIDNPRWRRESEAKLAVLQRRRSRSRKVANSTKP